MSARRWFPVMLRDGSWPVPWDMVTPHEAQAKRNHDQTIERLAERGGLSPCELVALIEGRRWQRMDEVEARRRVMELVIEWEARERSGKGE